MCHELGERPKLCRMGHEQGNLRVYVLVGAWEWGSLKNEEMNVV